MNNGTILTGFLHFRPSDKASGRLFELILDSTDSIFVLMNSSRSDAAPIKRFEDLACLKDRIAASFGLKVAGYEKNAIVQHALLNRLLPRIMSACRQGSIWADFGCGDGILERDFNAAVNDNNKNTIIGFDISRNSLAYCRQKSGDKSSWVCADIDHSPLKPSSLDGLVCASVLQWSSDIKQAISNISAHLKPKGIFIFSLFVEGSFHELFETKRACGMTDPMIFVPSSDIEAYLDAAGFIDKEIEQYTRTVYFTSAWQLLRNMSATGSTGAFSRHMSRSELEQLCRLYEKNFRTDKGVPLTYNAFMGSALKGGYYG